MSKEFFNSRAAIWDEAVAEKETTKLEAMAERLDIKPGFTVLDVGTGTGVFIPFILPRIGENGHLVCLDHAEEMLKRAKGKGFKGNIQYVCISIEQSELPDESFDTVICYSSFPHFEDKQKALSEIHRVLKKGGRMFICHTSNRKAINKIHRRNPEIRHHLIPEKDEMLRLLANAKFQNIVISDHTDYYLAIGRKVD